MAGFQIFDRELRVIANDLAPEAVNKALATFAKENVAELIATKKASANYERFVNGRPGLPEESVQAPGPIVYVFSNWRIAIESAIEELAKRAPHKSGRYAGSFLVIAENRVVTNYQDIPSDGEVVIINKQPYTRKVETGANKTGARHFQLAKGAFNRRFSGAFKAETTFLNVGSGIDPLVPYTLRHSAGRRKGRQAGQPITYPALILSPV